MSQMNTPVSNHTDDLERDSQVVLEQLASTRKKLDNGDLCEADLAAWKNPRIAVYNLEIAIQMLDLIKDLQSEVKELRQRNMELRENVALINEVLFESLDDDAGGDDDTSVPSDVSQSSDLLH
ncbi:hypothetical protein [Azovibrio restrictus]|uniref:hypothetical protein n=1 Tax=Azovibrio restrictus TaxID=146938 RepID=UPI0026EDFF5F|nr:hypothetical protein [Azovibrio restrictus]